MLNNNISNTNYPTHEFLYRIPFEKFCKLDSKYINLSNADLINKCRITPIIGNETAINIVELRFKLELQHKIINDQYKHLCDKYTEKCSDSDPTQIALNDKEAMIVSNLISSNIIEQYDNLNLVSLLQDHKNTHSLTDSDEITYIRNLIAITGIQRTILNQQQDKILEMAKSYLNSEITKREAISIKGTGVNIHQITDKDLIDNINLVKDTQANTNKPINPKSGTRVMTLPQYMAHMNIDPDKLSTHKKKHSKKSMAINKCCICSAKIKNKIGLVPCGHTSTCETCIINIHEKICPICEEPFTQHIKLH